jgi:hypothetical protein
MTPHSPIDGIRLPRPRLARPRGVGRRRARQRPPQHPGLRVAAARGAGHASDQHRNGRLPAARRPRPDRRAALRGTARHGRGHDRTGGRARPADRGAGAVAGHTLRRMRVGVAGPVRGAPAGGAAGGGGRAARRPRPGRRARVGGSRRPPARRPLPRRAAVRGPARCDSRPASARALAHPRPLPARVRDGAGRRSDVGGGGRRRVPLAGGRPPVAGRARQRRRRPPARSVAAGRLRLPGPGHQPPAAAVAGRRPSSPPRHASGRRGGGARIHRAAGG